MKHFSDKIILYGHSGERTVFPENTMEEFRYALDCNVDMIETDRRLLTDCIRQRKERVEIYIYWERKASWRAGSVRENCI